MAQPASRADLPAPTAPGAQEQLAFAEVLLACDEPEVCAVRCLDWLATHCGVTQALCAAIDVYRGPGRLLALAHRGIPQEHARGFSLDATQEDHPLVEMLGREGPITFDAGPATPLGEGPFVVHPLGRRNQEKALGLLLLRSAEPASPHISWAAKLLGDRIGSLHAGSARAEERRLRERVILSGIVESIPDPVLLTDAEGRRVFANARATWLFGWREGDPALRRRAATTNQARLATAVALLGPQPGKMSRGELGLMDPSTGLELCFELSALAMEDVDGRPGTLARLRPTTSLLNAAPPGGDGAERLRAAQAEAWSERHRMDVILDSVADPVLVTEPGGDIVLMNAPADRLFAVPPGSGAEAEKRVRANDAHFASFVSNLICSTDTLRWRGELSLLDPASGVPVPVEAMAGKVLAESGELSTVVTILHDRTEAMEKARLYERLVKASDELEEKVRAATAELAQQNELLRRQALELEQASAAKSQFLANMSHEFRTPLNAILGYTQMLLQGVNGELAPNQRKNLTRIDSNGRHLLVIINDILDITRIEAGRMPLHPTRFQLPELVEEVLAELEPIIQRSGLPLSRELPPRLPQLLSDRQKVKQVLVNLLSNALKFTRQGSITVSARYDAKGRALEISVSDTGIGIAEGDQQKVFEDFHQVDSSPTRAYGGTGLGLAICRRLASMLGGQLLLRSKLGEGATFTLRVPARVKRA